MRPILAALALTLLAAGCSKADKAGSPLVIPRAASGPVIDGKLDDACWHRALVIRDFTLSETDNIPTKSTVARVAFDNAALYVGCESAEPNPADLRRKVTREQDAVWSDDSIQVFIRTQGDFLEFYQFNVNASGVREWLRRGPGGRDVEGWTSAFRAKTAIGGNSWTAEIAIPWSDLGLKGPPKAEGLQLKIGRFDASLKPEQADIWPPGARFGGPDGLARVYVGAVPSCVPVEGGSVGPAIPVAPGKPVVIKKLLVADCRAVRGFVGAPVDGTTKSWGWDGQFYEYNLGNDGSGVEYAYRNNDGLHIKLADKGGFDAIQIRGGARTKIYRDVPGYTGPEGGTLIAELPGGTREASRVLFDKPVVTDSVSFFDTTDGYLSDVSFFRVDQGKTLEMPRPPDEPVVAAVKLTVDVSTGGAATLVVPDPCDSRRDLLVVDVTLEPGRSEIFLDFPDQDVVAMHAGIMVKVKPKGAVISKRSFEPVYADREAGAAEALAYRKLILHGLYCALSEARPWNGWWSRAGAKEFLASNSPYAPCARNVLDALDACQYIDREGTDDDLRQYYEWIWRGVLRKEGKTPAFRAKFDEVPGAPRWAVLAHQAWMQARAVPKWWLDHRLVPTGEFGGEVGDDTDMYGNYADFPMFESDGVGAELKEAGARLAALADETTMKLGVNGRTMDPLHAYEEGLNHWALMSFWHYGDPVYLERCMDSARSVAALTVVTPLGHRHFRSQEIGFNRIDDPKTDVDGGAHPLMWHPTFEVVRYNNNPTALKWLREWADGWLAHMKPGKYAKSVNVATETVVDWDNVPLNGAYGGQGSAFESLYWITGDEKYLQPFLEIWAARPDKDRAAPGGMIAELNHRGALKTLSDKLPAVLALDPVASDNMTKLEEALKVDITELQRYPMLYTTVEPFTDRVFLSCITNAAKCYTGGYETRNKYCRTHAVSWEGFGTDYAALVQAASPVQFAAQLYNFSDRRWAGRARFWGLDHGIYRVCIEGIGPHESGRINTKFEIQRGVPVDIELVPKGVTLVRIEMEERLDDLREWADLALSPVDTKFASGSVESVAHNIGSKKVADVAVALVDDKGVVREKKSLGPLAAPVDLVPKRISFRFDNVPAYHKGWAVVIDPDNRVTEIYEGNNRVELPL